MNKKVRKTIVAICMTFIMIVTVMYPLQGAVLVKADTTQTAEVNGTSWTYEEVTKNNYTYAKITKVNIGSATVLNIPSKLNNLPVGEIGDCVFDSSSANKNIVIEKVTIPSTVYKVGYHAFYKCTALKEVTFSNIEGSESLDLTIGVSAFAYCKNLEIVNIRKNINLLTISESAFQYCEKLKIEEFKSDVYIEKYAFYDCISFENLTFKGNAKLGSAVFYNAFQDTEQEKKITFEKDVTMSVSMETAPLARCSGLTELEFRGKVSLCEAAFSGDINLKKISWGSEVKLLTGLNSSNSIMGMQTFASCNSLKTFEFKSGNINLKNFWGEISGLEKVIYDGDISLDYWFDATNIVFKGNVQLSDNVDAISSKTKNIYFYQPNQNLDKLSASNINIYGIKGSAVENYVKKQGSNCAFKDVISYLDVTYDKSYILDNGPVDTLKPEDINLKVYGTYLGDGGEKLLIPQATDPAQGYVFSYAKLAAGLNNDFGISFSSFTGEQKKSIQVLLKYRNLTGITAKLKTNEETGKGQTKVLEGKDQLSKGDIVVTAQYNHGADKVVTDEASCVIQNHEIAVGSGNRVKITYTDPYTNETKETTVNVIGTEKTPIEELRVSYNYGDKETGVIVETKINQSKLLVEQLYDNGTSEVLTDCNTEGSVKEVGKSENNKIMVTDPKTKRKGYVIINGIALGNLVVNYKGGTCVVGDKIDLDKIEILPTLENGTVVEKLDKSDVLLSEEIVKEAGYNKITVTYGNLSRIIEIPAIAKEVNKITVTLQSTIEEVPIGGRLDKSAFIVTEYYNNGTSKAVDSPNITVLDYTIVKGENMITIEYMGKEYQVTVKGVEQVGIKSIQATYNGTKTLQPGDAIDLKEIKVVVFYKDGTSKVLPASEYEFADGMQRKIYIKSYAVTVPVDGILDVVSTSTPAVSPSSTPVIASVAPTASQEAVTGSPNPAPTIVAVNPSIIPIATSGAVSTALVAATETPNSMITEEPEVSPTIVVPTPTAQADSGVVFQINCNASKILLATQESKITKNYVNKTIIFTFTLKNGTGLKYQIVKKGKKVKENAWEKVKNNTLVIKKERPLSSVYFTYQDEAGNQIVKNSVYFSMDKTEPTTNVKNKTVYQKNLKITFKDSISGVKKAILNGKKIKSGTIIKKKGSYKLVVTDKAGNQVIRKFKVKK